MNANRNWTYIGAKLITYGFMAGAARYSFAHIVTLAAHFGCTSPPTRRCHRPSEHELPPV